MTALAHDVLEEEVQGRLVSREVSGAKGRVVDLQEGKRDARSFWTFVLGKTVLLLERVYLYPMERVFSVQTYFEDEVGVI